MTVPAATLQPGVEVWMLVTQIGSVSVTVEPVLASGPLFLTVRIQVTWPPGLDGVQEPAGAVEVEVAQ